uniref:Uncharacterized protein n=1 Tax=Ciona savignyi TaxID=51511 RepID=H2YXX0_CIOSA
MYDFDRMEKLAIKDGYRSVNDIIKRLCAGIVVEMETEYKIGLPSVSLKDVFSEQGAVCGGLGFVDALHPEWLLTVLEWMDPVAGCYKDDFKEIDEGFYYAKYFQTFEDRKNTWKSRKILVDSSTENGCSTHFTGVSIGFLSASLRLFYDPYYVKHRLPLYHKQLPTANMVNEPENDGLYQDDLIIVKVLLVLALFVLVCAVRLKGRKCTRIVRCCW